MYAQQINTKAEGKLN